MNEGRGGVKAQVFVGANLRIVPAFLGVILHGEHIVREDPTKAKLGLILRLLFQMLVFDKFNLLHGFPSFLPAKVINNIAPPI